MQEWLLKGCITSSLQHSPGSAVLLQSHSNVGRINPNLYQRYEKKGGTDPLEVTIFLSVFPLICTSFMGLRHTVAFAGHGSIHWV